MILTISKERRLFITESGSFCGWDVIYNRTVEMQNRLNLFSEIPEIGTVEQYEAYVSTLSKYKAMDDQNTWFDPSTSEAVRKTLKRCIRTREVIRVYSGNPDTGRCWLREHDTTGTVGRTTGVFKTPILVPLGEDGGDLLEGSSILAIQDALTLRFLYKSSDFYIPQMRIGRDPDGRSTVEVQDGKDTDYRQDDVPTWHLQASFDTYVEACLYIAFMHGSIPSQGSSL